MLLWDRCSRFCEYWSWGKEVETELGARMECKCSPPPPPHPTDPVPVHFYRSQPLLRQVEVRPGRACWGSIGGLEPSGLTCAPRASLCLFLLKGWCFGWKVPDNLGSSSSPEKIAKPHYGVLWAGNRGRKDLLHTLASPAATVRTQSLVASKAYSTLLTVSYKTFKAYIAFMRLIRWRKFHLDFLTCLFHLAECLSSLLMLP